MNITCPDAQKPVFLAVFLHFYDHNIKNLRHYYNKWPKINITLLKESSRIKDMSSTPCSNANKPVYFIFSAS